MTSKESTTPEIFPESFETRHLSLGPVGHTHFRELQTAELAAETAPRWRYRGATPSPERWAAGLSAEVAVQYVVSLKQSGRALGLVVLYGADPDCCFIHLGALRFQAGRFSPMLLVGTACVIDMALAEGRFRKLYLELPEYNLDQFGSGLRGALYEEARLPDHYFYAGATWAQVWLSITSDAWRSRNRRFLAMERQEEIAGQ